MNAGARVVTELKAAVVEALFPKEGRDAVD
jgi:hypothetical protein